MRTSSQTKFRSKLFSSKFDLRAGRCSNTAKVCLL
ncbi:BnaA01g27040D [Brassica napus]|uniref:BnaA01g27040D protein n=1 Tax=Brassica napus TaxID=3708 RepID=A0A078FZN2_BRANA|nr:BnaA01g27040D [Brassica napus]